MKALGRISTLIVDGDEDEGLLVRGYLLDGLGDSAGQVECVTSGAAALERLGRGGIDVVVVDNRLEDGEGTEFLRLLAASDLGIPALFLASATAPAASREALSAGATDSIVKPHLTPAGIASAARHAIESRARARDAQAAEEALRRSEERLSLVLEGSGQGVWDWNIETGDLLRDEEWARGHGIAPRKGHETPGTSPAWIHPDDRERAHRAFLRHVSGETDQFAAEYRVPAIGGGWRWILDRGRVVRRSADGKPLRIAGTETDVTDRREAEETLRRRDALLEAASFVAERLLGEAPWREALPSVLERLGVAARAGRAHLYSLRRDDRRRLLASLVDVWCAPGVAGGQADPTLVGFPFPPPGFEEWGESFLEGKAFAARTRDLPAAARESLGAWGVRATADVPVPGEPDPWGFLGFDDCESDRIWSPLELGALEASARMLGSAIARQGARDALSRRDAILQAVGVAGERLLAAPRWEEAVPDLLASLGTASGSSRALLFRNVEAPDGEERMRLLGRWVAPGAPLGGPPGLLDEIPRVPGGFEAWEATMKADRPCVSSARLAPEGARPLLAELGVRTSLSVPVHSGGQWWGVLVLDDCFEERTWTTAEVDATGTAARLLAGAIARQDARAALEASEERNRIFLELLPDAVIVHRGGRLSWVNPAALRLFGARDEAELVGRSVLDCVHPEDRQFVLDRQRRLGSAGDAAALAPERFLRLDGSVVEVEVAVSRVSLSDGPAFQAVARDVTARRQAEEAVRRRDAIVEASAFAAGHLLAAPQWEGVMDEVLARLGEATAASRAFLFRYSVSPAGEARSSLAAGWQAPDALRIPAGSLASLPRPFPGFRDGAEELSRGRPVSLLARDAREEARESLAAWGIQAVLVVPVLSGGEEWGCLVFEDCRIERSWEHAEIDVLTSVARMVGAAIGQQESARALQRSEERLRQTLDAVSEAVWEINLVTGEVDISPQFARCLGYEPEEIGADVAEAFRLVHPDDLPATRAAFEEHVAGRSDVMELENRRLRKDGRWQPMFVRGKAVERDAEGRAVRMVGVEIDMTRLKEAEEEARRSAEQLERAQRMEIVGRLSSGLAHDFNNVLNVITGYAEMGLGRAEGDEKLTRMFREIHRAARKAAALTKQLTAFGGRKKQPPIPVDLGGVVSRAEQMLRPLLGEDVRLIMEPSPVPARVLADPGDIEQALINLVVNARDAAGTSGVIQVRTGMTSVPPGSALASGGVSPGNYAVLAVEDDGPGIDPAVLPRIFEPFFSTKADGKGSGLGLATVEAVARRAGGTVQVESVPGRGTRFAVYLPLHAAPGGARTLSSARNLPSLEGARGSETVLILEDDPAVLQVLRDSLAEAGYTVLSASGPSEALHHAAEAAERIQLLVADVVLPSRSGPQTARAIASRIPGLKVLFVSGWTEAGEKAAAEFPGATFLAKPFSQADLRSRVRAALDGLAETEGDFRPVP